MNMNRTLSALVGLFAVFLVSAAAVAETAPLLREHAKGSPNAPITVVEYSSLTCSHCGHFYTETMPELEKRYIDTGKVRFVYRDFPVDGIALKASALINCMPESQFFPFLAILYKNQMTWLRSPRPDETLLQYAQMAGLPADKAKACLQNDKLLDAIVAERTAAMDKLNIQATPTFIINNAEEQILGAQDIGAFATVFDRILAAKKK